MGYSLWQKDRMVTHILFDLCLFKHLGPVANFGNQSIVRKLNFVDVKGKKNHTN